ncbi:MAG: biotin/lipoyl-binding protein [Proteobacteria bacterium]|nr:biotin/lipoyl-binding protein [Pseudomonadota bacterium]
MIIEVKLDNDKMERVKVTKNDDKFFVSFLDRDNTKSFEANFEECGQFYSVIIENKPFLVKFVEDGNMHTVTAGPCTSIIEAENHEKKARRELRETFSVKVNVLKTKIPGKIMEVLVRPGQIVKKGDELFVLEAMKMENRIFSPRDGVVKEIKVKKDDILPAGSTLLTFNITPIVKPTVN